MIFSDAQWLVPKMLNGCAQGVIKSSMVSMIALMEAVLVVPQYQFLYPSKNLPLHQHIGDVQ
jgi:hypothetical protein